MTEQVVCNKKDFPALIELAEKDESFLECLMQDYCNIIHDNGLILFKKYRERVQCIFNEANQEGDLTFYNTIIDGLIHFFMSESHLAQEKLMSTLENGHNWQNKNIEGMVYMMAGASFRSTGDYGTALKHIEKSISLIDTDSYAVGYYVMAHFQLGELYQMINELDIAEKYLIYGLQVAERKNEDFSLFRIYSSLANLYLLKKDIVKSKTYLSKAEINSNSVVQNSRALNDFGVYYEITGEYDKALTFAEKSLQIRTENNMLDAASTCEILIGKIKLKQGHKKEALQILSKALKTSIKYKSVNKMMDTYYLLAEVYEQLEDIKNAYEHFKKYEKIKSDLLNNKQKEIFKIKNEQIAEQRDKVEFFHDSLQSSIRYAQRIQQAMLPSAKKLNECLPDHFILFKPKDVVAGDFYWTERIRQFVVFAVADCTGHGVPGAMLSVVCHNALNRSVLEFGLLDTGSILDATRDLIVRSFADSGEQVNDGMDIALCIIDTSSSKLSYSGANNNLFLIRNGELTTLKANRQPIGRYDKPKPFKSHTISLEEKDSLYIFTDGYADQFGGEFGKKFMTKAFKDLLLEVQGNSMLQQKEILNSAFNKWKGKYDQIDDVCIMGLNFKSLAWLNHSHGMDKLSGGMAFLKTEENLLYEDEFVSHYYHRYFKIVHQEYKTKASEMTMTEQQRMFTAFLKNCLDTKIEKVLIDACQADLEFTDEMSTWLNDHFYKQLDSNKVNKRAFVFPEGHKVFSSSLRMIHKDRVGIDIRYFSDLTEALRWLVQY